MHDLTTSLIREKFIIEDPNQGGALTALSNRLAISLKNREHESSEHFVVRAHNMHSCVRMSAKIIQDFNKLGPIINRPNPIDWLALWDSVVNEYEREFNPERWISIYHRGKAVFQAGSNIHPFLDLIERCDFKNKGNYEEAIPIAEKAFAKTGKNINIHYDGNVALSINFTDAEARCGVILRAPNKTTTFTFTAHPKTYETPVSFAQCLYASAAFLEATQLAFMVGMNEVKLRYGLIERGGTEEKKTRHARKRLGYLSTSINNFEDSHKVNYRPERPQLKVVIKEAEKFAAQTLEPAEDSGFIA